MASFRNGNVTLGGNRTTTTTTTPTGTATNDELISIGYLEDDRTPTHTGFTLLRNDDHSGSAMDAFWWRQFMSGSPAASYAFTNTPATWTSHYLAAVQNASASILPVVSTAAQGTGTAATANAVTPVGDNACVIFAVLGFSGIGPVTPPGSYTEQHDVNDNLYIATRNLGAGTAGVSTGTVGITGMTSQAWIAAQILVEDVATVAGGGTPRGFRRRRAGLWVPHASRRAG